MAVIQDMWKDAPKLTIREEVKPMRLNPVNAFMTRKALEMLRRRAYTKEGAIRAPRHRERLRRMRNRDEWDRHRGTTEEAMISRLPTSSDCIYQEIQRLYV